MDAMVPLPSAFSPALSARATLVLFGCGARRGGGSSCSQDRIPPDGTEGYRTLPSPALPSETSAQRRVGGREGTETENHAAAAEQVASLARSVRSRSVRFSRLGSAPHRTGRIPFPRLQFSFPPFHSPPHCQTLSPQPTPRRPADGAQTISAVPLPLPIKRRFNKLTEKGLSLEVKPSLPDENPVDENKSDHSNAVPPLFSTNSFPIEMYGHKILLFTSSVPHLNHDKFSLKGYDFNQGVTQHRFELNI